MCPIRFEDVAAARARIRGFLPPTPLERHAALEDALGVRVMVKREDRNPTGSFKARNGLSALTARGGEPGGRGVIAATRGNHGLGLAWAGRRLGIPVTVCVPVGNSATKNAAMRELGAELVEEGADYDAAVAVMERLVRERGLHPVHSTNDRDVIAGAGTLTLEICEEAELDAMVVAVGGGSQAVGALTVLRRLQPGVEVYGVQAAGAAAIHDSWHAGHPVERDRARTFADGLATRKAYALTFPALREGLAGFVTCTDDEIAAAARLLHGATGVLPEGAGAAGLAGVVRLREKLRGKRVAVVFSGANLDPEVRDCLLAGGTPPA